MKTKHTKGNWIACKITNTTNYSVRTIERPELIVIPTNLTDINESIHNDILEEAIANAKLIAAAPDLLNALNDLVEKLSPYIYKLGVKKGFSELVALEEAKKAIRKATE